MDSLNIVRTQVVPDQQHVDGQFRQFHDDGMLDDLVGYVHMDFVYGKRRFRADGVPAYFKVALDITYVACSSIFGLLDDGVSVSLEAVDEAVLGSWGGRFDGV